MSKVSVIIPARDEKYLQATIENVLANARGDIEVIAVCDGYWPDPPVKDDKRVNIIHHSEPRGQRQSINEAARVAQGEYVMKLDAHCTVDEGFDVKLAADCEPDWTVVPRMYNLDIDTFTPKTHKRTDYMYMAINENDELRAQYYSGAEWKRQHKKTAEIDDTMCCMGPGWFMHKDRFWELGGCDEAHGSWGQQGVEVSCKAWLSGGALKVNKKTWFAHWFRGSYQHDNGRKGFPYSISQRDIVAARKYSKDLWLNNKWDKQTRNFQWLLDKFEPPGWTMDKYPTEESRLPLFTEMYRHIHKRQHDSSWKGVQLLKFPTDMILYSEVIHEEKPEAIIEIGTKFGGSALFFKDLLGPKGVVVTIDIKDQVKKKADGVHYIVDNSRDKRTINAVARLVDGKRTMVTIDGDHNRIAVKWDIQNYKQFVSVGQYLVIEDCYTDRGLWGPGQARDWFLGHDSSFKQTNLCKKYIVGMTMGGWLKRVK